MKPKSMRSAYGRRLRRQRPASEGVARAVGTHGRPASRLRTIHQTAEFLNVSPRTVRRAIESGDLTVHRIGRLVRIADADIAAFLAVNRSV